MDIRKNLKQKHPDPLKQVHERKARQNNFEIKGSQIQNYFSH